MTAGVASAFGSAPSAEAEIHYSGVLNLKFNDPDGLPYGQSVEHHRLPLGNRVGLKFLRAVGGSYYVAGAAGIFGAEVSNALRVSGIGLARLEAGDAISTGSFQDVGAGGTRTLFWIYNSGNFATPGEGFVGFKFDNGDGVQDGWARLEMGKYPKHNCELVDYAWGGPGEPVVAGQTASGGGAEVPVPVSGSLGLLALGGAGLMAWRKQRASSR